MLHVFQISEPRVCQEIAGYLKIGVEDWFNDHAAIEQLFWQMVTMNLISNYDVAKQHDKITSIELRFKVPHGWGEVVNFPPESFARFALHCLRLNEED